MCDIALHVFARARQANRKARAAAWRTFDADFTTVSFEERARAREPDAPAGNVAAGALPEFEDSLAIGVGDAGAVVVDGDFAGRRADSDIGLDDAARAAVFDCIFEQAREQKRRLVLVELRVDRTARRRGVEPYRHLAFERKRFDESDRALERDREIRCRGPAEILFRAQKVV